MAAWKDWDSSEKHQNSAKCLKEHDKQIKDNRSIWSTTTNIAQGGHDESAESDNWGSFIAVLETTAKHDKTLKKKGCILSIKPNTPAKQFWMRFLVVWLIWFEQK